MRIRLNVLLLVLCVVFVANCRDLKGDLFITVTDDPVSVADVQANNLPSDGGGVANASVQTGTDGLILLWSDENFLLNPASAVGIGFGFDVAIVSGNPSVALLSSAFVPNPDLDPTGGVTQRWDSTFGNIFFGAALFNGLVDTTSGSNSVGVPSVGLGLVDPLFDAPNGRYLLGAAFFDASQIGQSDLQLGPGLFDDLATPNPQFANGPITVGSITVVPEPSFTALLLMSFAGLGIKRRRIQPV